VDSLVGTGSVDEAAIFSVDGKDNWAHSANFKVRRLNSQLLGPSNMVPLQITPEEMKVIVGAFSDPNPVYGSGFKVNGVKYTLIQALDNVLRGKDVSNQDSYRKEPIVLTLLIGKKGIYHRQVKICNDLGSPPRND
jgi:hypothetical protein